jgi:hypothetical protein
LMVLDLPTDVNVQTGSFTCVGSHFGHRTPAEL